MINKRLAETKKALNRIAEGELGNNDNIGGLRNDDTNSEETTKLLYSNDFSDCGQLTYDQGVTDQNIYCRNGKLHLVVQKEGDVPGSILPGGINFDNYAIEVEATQEGGPNENDYGVMLRYVNKENFYYFQISGNGKYAFSKFQNGKWDTIIPWTTSPAINKGKATNKLKAECIDDKFTLYVNDIRLRKCNDNAFSSGENGLFIGTHSIAGVHISFDNLKIWAL